MSEYKPRHVAKGKVDPDTIVDQSFENLRHSIIHDPANATRIEARLDAFLRVSKEYKHPLGALAIGGVASACNHIEEVEGIPRKDIRRIISRHILRLPDFDRYDNHQWKRFEGIQKAKPGKVLERTNFLLVRLLRLPDSDIKK